MKTKQKLELMWIGKENRAKLEPRILLEEPERSYHAAQRISDTDIYENLLIQGDNLLALKALEQDYAGKVKCIFIDPPYNTGSAFEHYDDGIEHSLWLSLMRERIILLKTMLSSAGALWITIDNNEAHYLKVLCDEIFGRNNFIGDISWFKRISPANDALYFSSDYDHVLVYAKDALIWRPNRLERTEAQLNYYANPDKDPRGPWNSAAYTCAKSAEERPNLYYSVENPNTGEIIWPKRSRVWAYGKEQHEKNVAEGRIWWGKDGKGKMPRIKKFLENARLVVPRSVWLPEETGHNQEANLECAKLFGGSSFSTPKPERLIQRVLQIATTPGDLVLDSFLGSGTTAAVAHKMGRRWIGIELGEHCHTHCLPRLRKVIDGADPGGITEAVGWKGGGGFRYYRLAPSLLSQDKWGNWVISSDYNAPMLAEAICKLEGFTYAPSDTIYWQHGRSTEQDFLYVTTASLNHDQLQQLSDEVGSERTLLVVCTSFRGRKEGYPNLTVKKIPKAVLTRCEWGHDDYSLKVENLPAAPKPVPKSGQQSLFEEEAE